MPARTILIYGESGTYKTTQAGYLARMVHQRSGKKTRLISADGGGWAPIQCYVDDGIIEVVSVPELIGEKRSALAAMRRLSHGYWRGSKLPLEQTPLGDVGAYVVEGLSSIAELFMYELRRDMRFISDNASTPFSVTGDAAFGREEKFAASSISHYGFVQNEVASLVRWFSSLPVEYVLFTAHEGEGEEGGYLPIRGPLVIGKAATARAPAWVGDCIHAESYAHETADQSGLKRIESVVRMWFVRHPDLKLPKITYPAKVRLDPRALPELMKTFPGYFVPTPEAGLDMFIEATEKLRRK